MREEMNRREAELNEAALEGVSGGEGMISCQSKAGRICFCCPLTRARACYREGELAEHLWQMGIYSVNHHTECPYFH